jgi:hypothetical protein
MGTGPGYRRGRIRWSPGPHAQALWRRPQSAHMLCHQIHQSRRTASGTPTETSVMGMEGCTGKPDSRTDTRAMVRP